MSIPVQQFNPPSAPPLPDDLQDMVDEWNNPSAWLPIYRTVDGCEFTKRTHTHKVLYDGTEECPYAPYAPKENLMDREEIKRAIEVMQHYANGGEVEIRERHTRIWRRPHKMPAWNWWTCDYRIKQEPVKRWVNVYPNDTFGKPCKDRAECDLLAKRAECAKRIACIQIEYTPGEGIDG